MEEKKLTSPFMFFTYCRNCSKHETVCTALTSTMCCSCGNWERDTGKCLIHGEIPDFRGCCAFFEKMKIYDCLDAVVIELKNKRIYCTILDTGSGTCEECYQLLIERTERQDRIGGY